MWKLTTAPLSPSGSEQKPLSSPGYPPRRPGPPLLPVYRIENTPQKALSVFAERAFCGAKGAGTTASFRGKKSRALRAALSGFLRTARPFPSQAAAARAFFVKGEQKNQAPAAAGSKKPGKPHHKFFQGRAPQPESKGSCPEPFSDKPRSRAFFQVLSRSRFEAGNSASCRIRLSAIFFISGVSCRYFFITSEEVSFRGGVKASSSKAA